MIRITFDIVYIGINIPPPKEMVFQFFFSFAQKKMKQFCWGGTELINTSSWSHHLAYFAFYTSILNSLHARVS